MMNDGPGVAVFGIMVLILTYGVAILIIRRGFMKKTAE